jgi:hypothetical protein
MRIAHPPGMTLQKVLFEPTLVRSPLRVVQWWESRRLFYNVVVGTAGIGSAICMTIVDSFFRGSFSPIPWQPIVIYGVLANVCYTSGWVVENLAERWLQRPVYGLGPALFRYGLAFSVGLTLLPGIAMTAIGVIAGILKIF